MSLTIKETLIKRNELLNKFKRIFGFDAPMDCMFALDIVALDERLKTPDRISLSEHIVKNYGEEADKLVDELIDLSEAILPFICYQENEKSKGLLKAAQKLKKSQV